MHRGYIKIWRKLYDSPVSERPAYLSVWIFILVHANHKDKKVIWNNKNITIKRGSFITSANKISKKTGVPRGTVERVLVYLKSEELIEEQITRKFRLILVCNYELYQGGEEQNEERLRNNGGTIEEQLDLTKKVKKVNNEKKVNTGEADLTVVNSPAEEFRVFIKNDDIKNKYILQLTEKGLDENTVRQEVSSFINYWTEPTKSGKMQRWETEKTFELGRRLLTWFRNYDKFNNKSNKRGSVAFI